MAAARNAKKAHEVSATPLADFFWIAGLDGQELLEAYARGIEHRHSSNATNGYGFEPTIEEDKVAELENSSILDSPRPTSPERKHDSFKRLSKLSDDARNSILSLNFNSASKRSSAATIRPANTSGAPQSTILSDVDFDKAMNKFAKDRESFFLDLNFAAGAVTKPSESKKPRPMTQKIIPEEIDQTPTRGFGSIRRHMSFKEMSSIKRQASVARNVSVRTSRRASNYNSVIPRPEALKTSPELHPLKRKFEPVLLDRYPQRGTPDESKRRGTFPDYVPMFAFPNDINIVSSDTRPRSTWHGFAMTASDNSRLYGVCIILWLPMKQTTANELERRCEEWRQANMTDVERELAASLAERLALERADLSRLLAELPHTPSGSDARDQLEDEISGVEEKINVMAEMLRPLRLGTSSKIDGLTESDTSGIWVPRAYGILGRDGSMTSFWKEWLRAVVVPMSDGAILRIPASSPKVGMWQPLERYVVNMCTEAPSPISSSTQTEIAIRELRLYARKTAENELPGSRNIDLYPLFRAMSVPNIMVLFEYLLAESRIILLSQHTSMLQLVSRALVDLLWPLQWTGVFIPVLPARLIQTLEAPCPYICGIERRYDNVELPGDDFVLVDLDHDEIRSPAFPIPMPKQQRRKLQSLLQLAAPHHHRYGVATGPPLYAVEAFAFDTFASENTGIFNASPVPTNLAKLVGLTSTAFGASAGVDTLRRAPVFNAFLQAGSSRAKSAERPITANTSRTNSNARTSQDSPITANFPPLPGAGLFPPNVQRNDSGYALQASLREKRSGHFDSFSRTSNRSNSISKRAGRRPSVPFTSHTSSPSTSTTTPDSMASLSNYAPSTYAQSTLAASTVMPNMLMRPVRNTDATSYVEGHCLNWNSPSRSNSNSVCAICDDPASDGNYRCSGCGMTVHGRCAPQISLVCSSAFYPDQIRAAFARCFASLFFTYRKYLRAPTAQQKKNGLSFKFNMDEYIRSLPQDVAEYTAYLRQTQAFNEFISEREMKSPSSEVASNIRLFDAIILAKRDRGKPTMSMSRLNSSFSKHNPFASKTSSASPTFVSPSTPEQFLQDTTEHLWRTATAPITSNTNLGDAAKGREYSEIVSRVPAKLEEGLMKEPRMIHGVPRISERMRHPGNFSRKGVAPSSRDGTSTMGSKGHVPSAMPLQAPPTFALHEQAQQHHQQATSGRKMDGERDMSRAALMERMNGLNLNPPC